MPALLTAPAAPPAPRRAGRWGIVAGGATIAAAVPLCFLGPGTDLDVGAVLHAGRSLVRDGDYVVSRAPGAPVHEAAVGVLERVGGTVAPNLGSLAAGVALVALLVLLLRREGVGRAGLAAAVVVANPWFLVAATSTVDFLWALALWAGAALTLRTRPSAGGAAAAGLLAGLAIGCRASTAVLVAGLALAEALDAPPPDRVDDPPPGPRPPAAHPTPPVPSPSGGAAPGRAAPPAPAPGPRTRAAVLAGVAGAVGALLFLPPFLSTGASLAFAQNDVPASSLPVQVGRFLVKDLYFVGPFAAVVLLLALPALGRGLLRWRADWLVRVGALTVAGSQLLFLRFPWKMGHLLPTLVGLTLLAARALADRPRLLAALVAAQLLYGAVNVQLVEPDTPNAATSGRLTFSPRAGALVVDTRCRRDDPGAWHGPGITRLEEVWACAKPWAD